MSTTVKSTPPRTPSPWRLESHGWDGLFIRGNDERVPGNNRLIAEASLMYDGAEANAAFIVRACNSHDALVKSLRSALATIEDYLAYEHNGDPWTEDARSMGEMDINDFKSDGRLEAARAALAAAGVQP